MEKLDSKLKCETGIQLLARLGSQTSVSDLEPLLFPNLEKKTVIEIYGKAGSGKTEILYHLITRCILPEEWNGIKLNGIGISVLLIDTDQHFNLLRLVAVIEKHIYCSNSNNSESSNSLTIDNVLLFVKERLRLLHIMKCYNNEQFLITLCSLDKLLTSNAINVMFIDSISAFHWLDRMNFIDNSKKLEQHYERMTSNLHRMICDYNLVLIVTKQILTKSSEMENYIENEANSTLGNYIYDFMGKHWKKFVNYRLLLQKTISDNKTLVNISVINEKEFRKINGIITDNGLELQIS